MNLLFTTHIPFLTLTVLFPRHLPPPLFPLTQPSDTSTWSGRPVMPTLLIFRSFVFLTSYSDPHLTPSSFSWSIPLHAPASSLCEKILDWCPHALPPSLSEIHNSYLGYSVSSRLSLCALKVFAIGSASFSVSHLYYGTTGLPNHAILFGDRYRP